MCGIVGFFSGEKKGKEIELLKRLIVETSVRGLHSFGIAFTTKNGLKVKKDFNLDVDKLLKPFIKNGTNRLIFHCRYSTSGDFHDMNNNQPIVVGNTAIVLNGIISMETKKFFEKQFGVKCITHNDTEIFLRKKYEPIKFLKKNPKVSFAGLILKNDKLIALRNNKRPMYVFATSKKTKFFISTIDIARRSGVDVGKVKPIPTLRENII